MPISQTFPPKQVRLRRRTSMEKYRRRLPAIPSFTRDHPSMWLRTPAARPRGHPRGHDELRPPATRHSRSDSTPSACPLRTLPPVPGAMLPPYRVRAEGVRTRSIVPVGGGRPIGCHGPGRVGLVHDHEQRSRKCALCFSTSSFLKITYVTG